MFTFPSTVPVTSGEWYLIGLHTGGTASAVLLYRIASGGFFFFKSGDTYSDGPAATFGTPDDSSAFNVTSYVTGTPTGAGNPGSNPTAARRITARATRTRTVR